MLANHPDAGRRHDELGADVRAFPVSSYLICYRVDVEGLQILRILHTSRDIKADLFED